jgi:hypothetical protein
MHWGGGSHTKKSVDGQVGLGLSKCMGGVRRNLFGGPLAPSFVPKHDNPDLNQTTEVDGWLVIGWLPC